jgi:hypothetical protein
LSDFEINIDNIYEVFFHDYVFTVSINGINQTYTTNYYLIEGTQIYESEDVDEHTQELIDLSKARVIAYIQSSEILMDKEYLIERLEEVEVRMAAINFSGVYKNGIIYLDNSGNKVCVHVITHEYIHALSQITNTAEDFRRMPYAFGILVETITSLIDKEIASSVGCCSSMYAEHYETFLLYIGIFKKEAIRAYFYGYDILWSFVDKTDFDFFVHALNFADEPERAIYINSFINKWAQQSKYLQSQTYMVE